MENIRIGNSVHVSWRLYNNNGSQYALSGKIRRLWIISAALEKEITSYGIQGRNEIVFSIPADDLIRYGTYKIRLTIRESESETEDATYDLTQIFQVVSQSYPNVSNAIGGVADLSFTSVLNNVVIERIEGLSAYEIAVNNGYEGTEQEWIAMYDNAVTAANNAAEEAIAATEAVMANEESRQLAESARDTAEQSRVSGEQARAQAEQARQAAEQGRASAEQERAIAETARETRAASDHATAQSDHATAANDHSVAVSDHTTALTDHTIASSDHTTAVADHEASTSATEDANDAADAANDAVASVQHIVETRIGSETIHNIVELTQAEYDALQTKRDDTMYIITDTEIPSSEVGIAGFEQTAESTEDGGTNIWTVTLTNGQTFQLAVKNGNQGNSGYSGAAGELEVVNNLVDGGATAALSAEMGVVLEEEVSQLGQKIDEFAQGKFYGYFADADELPAGDISGFAYVGTEAPFAIYNFDGENWSDSGLTVNGVPVGNGEDIDQDENGKLQFANRVNGVNTTGMGYVVLRKNKTFAEQVTATNTIYEIRYDFDLGAASVTIPAGCILRFDGGCINNGVLSGNNTSIIGGDYKIFNGVTFAGTWKGDINACWIGVRQNDSTFDNSPILQAWFDNYCEYFPGIVFPCSVYYFSSAVVLSSDKRNKHIYGDGSVFNVNIPTDDSVFITLNVGEAFSLRDIKFQNVRTTGAYNISKTTALHLIKTHQFGIQGVEIRNFDKGVWLTDVWYGNFYGKNSFWENRVALFVDANTSIEVNTIDFHNIRVSGCNIDAAKTLYPQESGESEADWTMRYARCGVDVHSTTYAVKYSGMVIEGVDYGIRYNYRPRSTQANSDALIIIENCYFEGNTQKDIYIGKGYVINPNNLAAYYVIAGGHVKIDSCLFHSTLDPHIYIKDCYTLITNCSPVKFMQDYQYSRSMVDAGEEVSANMAAGSGMTIKRSEKLQFPDANGNVYPATIRQTTGNIRNRNMASGLLNGTNALNINTQIYTSNGSGVARYIPAVQGLTDAPRVNVHFGIQPYEMEIMDNIYHVRIPSGNGSVRVACGGSQYITCVYSFRNDGIEITEFMRRWKAGTAYEGYVNQVFPFKVRSVPAEGKLYMENYQGVESLIGVGKKAIDDGFSFSTGYYMFVDALCYIFFAYSVPRFVSDLVQCGRSYDEMGIFGSSTAQYNKFRFVCTDAQRANLRPRMNAVIYNTTSKQLQIYDGTQWEELTDPFKRFVYSESGASISARVTAPDLPGQTYFNYATGITYRYALTSVDRYNGEWIGDIGQVSALDHPNGYDATSNPLDYVTELTAGEMVRCNGALYKWDGTQFVAL